VRFLEDLELGGIGSLPSCATGLWRVLAQRVEELWVGLQGDLILQEQDVLNGGYSQSRSHRFRY